MLLQKVQELQDTISTLTASVQQSHMQQQQTTSVCSPSQEVAAVQEEEKEHESQHSPRHIVIYIDGEKLMSSRLSARILADALQVLLPRRCVCVRVCASVPSTHGRILRNTG